ncbi:hypothetical protein Scep_014946 [Stephania cephalantha]|uniref:Glycosyl transferase CAP10 domain-containing protein n=1 Tax=Stephania cephalantha TaxID=152367 RepID=A0AAP0P2A6_9MAGN
MGSPYRLNTSHALLRPRSPFSPVLALFAFCLFTALLLLKLDAFISQTKTIAGHNLNPTPWHLFPPKQQLIQSKYTTASKIIQCSYLTCLRSPSPRQPRFVRNSTASCPQLFSWIHRDLEPWARRRVSLSNLMEAQKLAAFRVVIVGGRLYADFYYDCVQSRAMFTIWGLLQLLRRFPGMVPDVDLMFDCMDKPVVGRAQYGEKGEAPPPLFRYCSTGEHLDIPFPDWSFWGWPEVNIGPWNEEFRSIKKGSRAVSWENKFPHAYWKGNTHVGSPVRTELMRCNDSSIWRAQIMNQNWLEEAKGGYEQSKLSNQCKHRYKIYAEGYAWSVSLKYILSCDSVALIISPQYEDFFSRGLMPRENYWPVSSTPDLCKSIKSAVEWGNGKPVEAEAIGKRGQNFMRSLSMDRVYDYMYHLITEYSKLQDFKPSPPSSAQEMCAESLLCYADSKQKEFLSRSTASPSKSPPCTLPSTDRTIINDWLEKKRKIISEVQTFEGESTKSR